MLKKSMYVFDTDVYEDDDDCVDWEDEIYND